MDMDSRGKDLPYRMNVIKGSRFDASKRLEGRDRRMALLIALASALVIALTFMSTAYRLPSAVVSDLNVVTMVASVLILAVSLIQYSNDDAVNSEQHHRCGLEINELRGELQARLEAISEDDLRESRGATPTSWKSTVSITTLSMRTAVASVIRTCSISRCSKSF